MPAAEPRSNRLSARIRERGQIVVIFAMAIILFVGLCAIVIDVSWYWANSLRMQRAADAAALAGVIYLPGNVGSAVSTARAEAVKNGYTNGVGGVAVTPFQDATNNRRLRVTVSGPVNTFFARVLGISSFHASRSSKAEYVLPVPMGSPENYYGVFGELRHPGGGITTVTTNTFNDVTTSWFSASNTKGTNAWTTPTNVYTSNNVRSTSITANQYQQWGDFGITLAGTVTNIDGIEVQAEMSRSGTGNQSNCQIQYELSWDNGTTFTTGTGTGVKLSAALPLAASEAYQQFGAGTDKWNRTSWTTSQLSNTNFRVRVRTIKSSTTVCAAAILHQIDHLQVRVRYDYTTTTSTFTPDTNVASPYGAALTPRGFWGVMLTEGAESVNGDAYSPFYDTRTTANNPNFKPLEYYDYAVEMPAGSSGGEIWIFDPGFCAVQSDMGTGDRYFGNTNTNNSNEISAFYDVYDTKNTLYDTSDDGAAVASSGSTFARLSATDESMGGPALSGGNLDDCSATTVGSNTSNPQYYHNRWWQLASGLSGNKTYRIHVTSTNLANQNDQKNMNGQNSFAIWTKATGTAPKVHGLGAMEAYTPLEPSTSAEFYLAQIEAAHAGKTMEIKLWDPGDTNSLSANLQIRIPGTAGYTNASLNYTAAKGTTNTNANNCNSTSGTGASNIPTNSGGSGGQLFNGCWVTILIPIPTTYTAPTPPGEAEPGWWKIRYNMGSGSTNAFDLTTWQVQIRGNPVHLILP
jgi:Putative Flp pilus-assembly TadE/G-like